MATALTVVVVEAGTLYTGTLVVYTTGGALMNEVVTTGVTQVAVTQPLTEVYREE